MPKAVAHCLLSSKFACLLSSVAFLLVHCTVGTLSRLTACTPYTQGHKSVHIQCSCASVLPCQLHLEFDQDGRSYYATLEVVVQGESEARYTQHTVEGPGQESVGPA